MQPTALPANDLEDEDVARERVRVEGDHHSSDELRLMQLTKVGILLTIQTQFILLLHYYYYHHHFNQILIIILSFQHNSFDCYIIIIIIHLKHFKLLLFYHFGTINLIVT